MVTKPREHLVLTIVEVMPAGGDTRRDAGSNRKGWKRLRRAELDSTSADKDWTASGRVEKWRDGRMLSTDELVPYLLTVLKDLRANAVPHNVSSTIRVRCCTWGSPDQPESWG